MSKTDKSWNDFKDEEEGFLKEHGDSLRVLRELHSGCPPPDIIMAAGEGALSEEALRPFEMHLAACSRCQVVARDLKKIDVAGPSTEEEARIRKRVFVEARAPGEKKFWLMWIWQPQAVAILAVAVLACSSLTWMYLRHTPPKEAPEQVAVPSPSPSKTNSAFQLDKPAVKFLATSVMIWRGESESSQGKYLEELKTALEPYEASDFAGAAAKLAEVAKRYPRGAEARFYLGISRLFLEQNADAIAALREAESLAGEALSQDISWYMSLALQRTGDMASAVARLKGLCESRNMYTQRACQGIKELTSAPGAPTRR